MGGDDPLSVVGHFGWWGASSETDPQRVGFFVCPNDSGRKGGPKVCLDARNIGGGDDGIMSVLAEEAQDINANLAKGGEL